MKHHRDWRSCDICGDELDVYHETAALDSETVRFRVDSIRSREPADMCGECWATFDRMIEETARACRDRRLASRVMNEICGDG